MYINVSGIIVNTLLYSLLVDFGSARLEGFNVKPGEFPFVIAMMNSKNGLFRCGGVLISEIHVLTTGICLVDKKLKPLKPTNYEIYAGTVFLWNKQIGFQSRHVNKFHLHPKFNGHTATKKVLNNVGVIHTETPFKLTKYVNVISIFSEFRDKMDHEYQSMIKSSVACQVLGWEDQSTKVKYPKYINTTNKFSYYGDTNMMRRASVFFRSYDSCNTYMCKATEHLWRTCSYDFSDAREVCATTVQGGISVCGWCECLRGAPVVCENRDSDQHIIWGLATWGVGCTSKGLYPTAYASFQIIADVFREYGITIKKVKSGQNRYGSNTIIIITTLIFLHYENILLDKFHGSLCW